MDYLETGFSGGINENGGKSVGYTEVGNAFLI
jgi:hypothetical protein